MGRWLWAALGISGLTWACDKPEAPTGSADPAATATSSAASEAGQEASFAALGDPVDAGPLPTEAPLLYFMKEQVATAMRQGDVTTLAAAFDRIAAAAPNAPPPAYANWASIAKDGAAAARAASVEGAKGACRGCHAQYRNAYKAEMRARPLP